MRGRIQRASCFFSDLAARPDLNALHMAGARHLSVLAASRPTPRMRGTWWGEYCTFLIRIYTQGVYRAESCSGCGRSTQGT